MGQTKNQLIEQGVFNATEEDDLSWEEWSKKEAQRRAEERVDLLTYFPF